MKAASDLLARALRGDLAWTATESWEAHVLATAADHHGVGPLVWRALQSHGTRPHGLYEIFAAARHVDLAHEILRHRETARVLEAFRARGLDVLLVKGAALAYSVYDEAWLRPRVDTDLLVDSRSFVAADRLLHGLGYAPAAGISTGEFVSHQVAYEYRDCHGLSHVIDLHWKTANPQLLADALPFAILWRDAIEVHRGELRGRAPSLPGSLLLACVHRLAHHQPQERLVWLFDIHLLAGNLDDAEWNRVTSTARERGITAVCRSGLDAAIARLGTVVPAEVLAALDATGGDEPSRVYTERTQRRLDVLRADLRHLPRWRDRLQLLTEHAFPPTSFVMARYAARRRALLPVLYAHRLVTGAWRWLRRNDPAARAAP